MTQTASLNSASVFVVSGGAKGITAECVIKLAQHKECNFILLGRSALVESEPDFARDCLEEPALKKRIMENLLSQGEKPTPMSVQKVYNKITSSREIKKTLLTIEEAGSKAEYISVDVTDAVALKEKIAAVVERTGAITGIIHGAGNLADKLIEKKTEQDFETVYTAKVKGLENLLSCVNTSELDYLVLFSSVTGFYGNIGQTDYAIANEILNKSAHLIKQHNPACHVVAINWGAWDSGMVTPELKKVFAQRNIDIIPIDVGTQILVEELDAAYHDIAQVVIGNALTPHSGVLDSQFKTYNIRRQLSVEANPFVLDHVIAGYPVLPATCAMSWMINTAEQLYPGYRYASCQDFRVLKGITFNETLAKEHTLELKEIEKNAQEIKFQATIWSQTPTGKIHYHFKALIQIVLQIAVAPTYQSVNLTEDNIIKDTGKAFYQNGDLSLFHGPSFQQITRVINITHEKITTECYWQEITDIQQGQFPVQWVNPYTTDLSTQGLWIWLQHLHKQICLPGQMERYEQYLPTPCNEPFYVSCEIKAKTDTSVTADFIIHSSQGQIYSRLLGTKGVILPDLTRRKS